MLFEDEPPKQAVILAGGRGTRLWPLTETIPKPMILFNGKPFLAYLLSQLKDQGIKRVLLLLGYLPETVQSFFRDGKDLGLFIEYSISDPDDDTGRRIYLAREKLDSIFWLLYCDNYWPMNAEAMWQKFSESGADAQITVYTNRDDYTRSNVRVDEQGWVVCYDRHRNETNLNGVEIGYAIMKRKVVDLLPNGNIHFEKKVYPYLTVQRRLAAYVTDHRYYSVGSHDRLHLTESFLARRPAVILDRDGVLNRKPPKAQYVRCREELKWLPGAKDAIRLLSEWGYRVIIVTNQAGIARGFMTEADLMDIHRKIESDVASSGGYIDAIYHCPHGWDEGCDCRKPKPGMLFQAQRDFNLDLSRTVFIGDDDRDRQAGESAGCRTLMVTPDTSLLEIVQRQLRPSDQ